MLDGRKTSDDFEVQSRVRQGCILMPTKSNPLRLSVFFFTPPFLANVADLNRPSNLSLKTSNTQMICLLSRRFVDLGQMNVDLGTETRKFGRKINTDKTKVLGLICRHIPSTLMSRSLRVSVNLSTLALSLSTMVSSLISPGALPALAPLSMFSGKPGNAVTSTAT